MPNINAAQPPTGIVLNSDALGVNADPYIFGSGPQPIANHFGQVGGNFQVGLGGEVVPPVVQVTASRALTAADSGRTLAVAAGLTITVPAGLPLTFGVIIKPLLWNGGSISVVSSGGALLNGATTTLTRGYTFSIINATAMSVTETVYGQSTQVQTTYAAPTLNSHKVS